MTADNLAAERRAMLRFFLPLACTSALMMTSHSLIAGGIARTTLPVASLAAYSVGSNIAFMAEAPMVMVRQMTMALARGVQSFRTVARVAAASLAVITCVTLLIAYTPLGRIVFGRVLGVPVELQPATLTVFRVTLFVPFASGLRSLYQGTLILRRRTVLVIQAMFARIAMMGTLVYCLNRFHWVAGGLVGAVAILAGMSTEAIVNTCRAYKDIGCLADEAGGIEPNPPGFSQTLRFYYPLALAALAVSVSKPLINAGLARMADPVVALAAFSVASSVGFIIIAPAQNIHQLTMVFGRDGRGASTVWAFVRSFGLGGSAVLACLSCSDAGSWVLRRLVGAEPALVEPTLAAMRVFSLLPVIISAGEYFAGLLLLRQETRVISLGKVLNIGVVLTVIMLARTYPGLGSVGGAMAQVAGYAAEMAVLYLACRRLGLTAPPRPADLSL